MTDGQARAEPFPVRNGWFILIGLEVLCVAGFLTFTALGMRTAALGFLAGPLQLLVWAVLMRDEYWVLLAFTAAIPLAYAELLPLPYHHFVFYPGTVAVLAVLLSTRFLFHANRSAARLTGLQLAPVLILGGWMLLSFANSVQRGWSSNLMLKYTPFALELLAIGCFFAVVPRALRQVKVLVLVLIGMTVAVSVLLPFLPAPVGEGGILGGKLIMTPFSTFNLNHFGGAVAAVAIIVLSMLAAETRFRDQVLLGAALVPLLVVMVLTKSRGAWLGFGIAYVYVLLRARSPKLLVASVALGLALLSLDVVRSVLFVRAGETSARDPALAGRLLLWQYAWDIGRHNWLFGVGYENFRHVKHLFGFPGSRAAALKYNSHNLYLEYFVNLGVVGLASYLWLLLGSVWTSDHTARARRPDTRGIATGLAGAVIVYMGHGLVDAVMFVHGSAALLAAIIGLSISLDRLAAPARLVRAPPVC